MSGLSHTPGKRAKGQTFRGFESRPLRQSPKTKKRLQGAFLFWGIGTEGDGQKIPSGRTL
jgi:hypothetical protein